MTTKQCNKCKKTLNIIEFYKHPKSKDGLLHFCKTCKRQSVTVLQEMKHGAKQRAKKKGIEYGINDKDILEINEQQKGLCAYSGILLNWDYNSKGPIRGVAPTNRASIDRIDSTKGYTKDNIQLLADIVNRMKLTSSYTEFLNYCRLVIDRAK